MPAWVSITIGDVRAEAAASRIEGSVSTDIAEIETHFETLRAGIVAEIRAKIGTHPTNALDADTDTVPPEWKGFACLRILSRMLSRLGQGEESSFRLTEDQRRELERRLDDLDRVAEGKLAVTQPSTAGTSEIGSLAAGVAIGGRTRRYSRDALEGL